MLTTASMAQEFTVEVQPGVIVIEGDYAWMCFPPGQLGLYCVKVHKSKFCPVESFEPGILNCIKPMMAEEEGEKT